MRNFVALVAKEGGSADSRAGLGAIQEVGRRAETLMAYTLPAPSPFCRHEAWYSSSGTIALFGFTNEPEAPDQPLLLKSDGVVVARVGYLAGPASERDFLAVAGHAELAREAGGCFAVIRCDARAVVALTDVTRSCGLYVAETKDVRIVGSRALLVERVRTLCESGQMGAPRYDRPSMRSMAGLGHFLGEQTPYVDVKALPEATTVRLDPWFCRTSQDPVQPVISANPQDSAWGSLVEEACDLLVRAFEPVREHATTLSLTGGRDSRLIAAAMSVSGISNFRTSTAGLPGHPDVDLAREIADRLDMEHELRQPPTTGDGLALAEDPLARIYRNLDVHDGMTSAWDDIGTYGPMSMRTSMSGVGGEILRGGLLFPDLDALDAKIAESRIRSTMLPNAQYFASDVNEYARVFAEPWTEAAIVDPNAAIDRYYYVHRNGRWVSARRSGVRFRALAIDPLLDNRFVRKVLTVTASSRWSERLVFDMVTLLAPQIKDLPLEGARWRFERSGPMLGASTSEIDSWPRRVGLLALAETRRLHWHSLADETMRNKVRTLVEERLSGIAGSIYDGRKVLEVFDAAPRYPTFPWHTATACVMMSDAWYETTRPDKVLDIPIPIHA